MVEVNNQTAAKINAKLFEKLAKVVLKGEGRKEGDISVAIVGTARMRELNRMYRGKDYPANVLSFAHEELGLGEIVLCPQVIRKEAIKHGIKEKEAFARMFVHGLMHLLGYDHEKTEKKAQAMENKEKHYLSQVTI